MRAADTLDQGRRSFDRRAWADAYAQLSAANHAAPLESDDLESLATAAYLTGRDADSIEAWERAHHEHVRRGVAERAARCAFWLAFSLFHSGESARGGGWLARARRLLDEDRRDCVEQGYLLVPEAIQRFDEDCATAYAIAGQAAEIGERFDDRDLVTLARQIQGRALLRQGQAAEGIALLDEVMVAVIAGDVSPIVAGDVYCSVIEACQEVFDLRRAHEWTAMLTHWCDSQPDMVLYRGQCMVHRAEIMVLHGAWPDAVAAVDQACEHLLRGSGQPAAGAALYQQADLHRLHGRFAEAVEAYRAASRWGREPQPGLALLRLAQSQPTAAEAAIRRVANEAHDRVTRLRLLPAYVEIMLAVRDVQAARVAADEVLRIADELNAPLLDALAESAHGAVLLAEGNARAALGALRRAWKGWQQLEAPYEAARVRVHIGLACRDLGDADGAAMELDAARWVFRQLGAESDLARAEALSRRPPAKAAGALTAREVEVLGHVAAGKTNRAIAADLFLSEKTVARHMSNIFAKLGITSRAAATAYAYQHDLV